MVPKCGTQCYVVHIACCPHRSWPVEYWQLVPKCGAVVTSIQEWLDNGTAVTGLGLLHSTRFGHCPVKVRYRFSSLITVMLRKVSHEVLASDLQYPATEGPTCMSLCAFHVTCYEKWLPVFFSYNGNVAKSES